MTQRDHNFDNTHLMLLIDGHEVILTKPETSEGGVWSVADLSSGAVAIILREVTSALVQVMPAPETVNMGTISLEMAEMLGLGLYGGRPPVGGLVTRPPPAPPSTPEK